MTWVTIDIFVCSIWYFLSFSFRRPSPLLCVFWEVMETRFWRVETPLAPPGYLFEIRRFWEMLFPCVEPPCPLPPDTLWDVTRMRILFWCWATPPSDTLMSGLAILKLCFSGYEYPICASFMSRDAPVWFVLWAPPPPNVRRLLRKHGFQGKFSKSGFEYFLMHFWLEFVCKAFRIDLLEKIVI